MQVMVPNDLDMDRETFRKHFNKRHADSLGGMTELPERFDDYQWGSFHTALHRWYDYEDHEHKEPEE